MPSAACAQPVHPAQTQNNRTTVVFAPTCDVMDVSS
jgi:hypothetical protein